MINEQATNTIEAHLIDWADWARGRVSHLGYPKASPLHRLMRYGDGAGSRGAPREDEPSENVARMEALITRLPHEQREAVRIKYLCTWLTERDRARHLKVSFTRYRHQLEQGIWFLRGAWQSEK